MAVSVTCEYCGAEFNPQYKGNKYCGRKCANRATAPPKGQFPLQWARTQARERNRLAHIGITYSKEINTRKGLPGPLNPFFGKTHSIKTRKLLSQKAKENRRFAQLNKDPEFQRRRLLACRKGPNRLEQALETLLKKSFPNEWKFVGDGQVILGGLNPDFINCNGRKLIIELFGDYWHGAKCTRPFVTEEERRDVYGKYGYRQLVIWEHELKELPERSIVEKVRRFVHETQGKV